MKKFLCLLFCCILSISMYIQDSIVISAEGSVWEDETGIVRYIIYAISAMGAVFNKDYNGLYDMSMDMLDRYGYSSADDIIQENSDGSVLLTDSFIDNLKEYLVY